MSGGDWQTGKFPTGKTYVLSDGLPTDNDTVKKTQNVGDSRILWTSFSIFDYWIGFFSFYKKNNWIKIQQNLFVTISLDLSIKKKTNSLISTDRLSVFWLKHIEDIWEFKIHCKEQG